LKGIDRVSDLSLRGRHSHTFGFLFSASMSVAT
jgi:hypothetical protein